MPESIIYSQLLTYTSEQESMKHISPTMFLKDIHEYCLPDVDTVKEKSFTIRLNIGKH